MKICLISSKKPWLKSEDEILIEFFNKIPYKDLLLKLPTRTLPSIRERIKKLRKYYNIPFLNKIQTLKDLKYYVGGHLHLNGRKSTIINGVTYYNAAICNDAYQVTRTPIIIKY